MGIDKLAIGHENGRMINLTLSPEQFAALHAGERIDLRIGDGERTGNELANAVPDIQVTLAPPDKKLGVRYKGLDDLSKSVMAPLEFTTEFTPGKPVTFLIRALDSDLAAECDKIGADVLPPKRKIKAVGPRGVETEEYDWEDQGFLDRRAKVNHLRQAFALTRGLIEFEIPGDNLEQKNALLRAKLPPRVIGALYSAITGLTSDAVKLADFS